MKTLKLLFSALLIAAFASVACQPDVQPEETFEFSISTADGSAVTGVQTFNYGGPLELTFTAKAVAKIEATAPNGWTATVAMRERKVTVKAPEATDKTAAESGNVQIVATSQSGQTLSETVAVAISHSAPVLVFTPTQILHVDFGSDTEVALSEVEHVASLELKSGPKGWQFTPDLAKNKVKLTAPAENVATYDGEGDFVVTAKSESNETFDYTIHASVKGINNVEEFVALATAYNTTEDQAALAAAVVDYMWKGEILLNSNIDLTGLEAPCAVVKDFAFTFNGKGHTINIEYEGAAETIGLFYKVVAPGKVCNLNFTGNITSTKYGADIAVVSTYSEGGTFENISSEVEITQTGADAESGAVSSGALGAIVSDEQGNGTYTGSSNSGPITFSNTRYVGGILGDIWDKTEGTVTNCSNSGPITGSFKGYDMGRAVVGGVIGNTIGSNWMFTDSYNTGNIHYSFNKNATGIRALGGFAGTVFGKYIGCYNTGEVINTDGINAQKATRRIGGFGGAAWMDNDCVFYGKNCYNTGKVSDITNYIGGFVGILEEGSAENYHLAENCYNTGTVICACLTNVSDAFGGFAGTLYNVVGLVNCRNEGKVVGVSARSAGGLVGRAADYIVIQGCTNSGDVFVGANEAALKYEYVSPVVGGICGVVGGSTVVTIANSANTGKVTAMSTLAYSVQSVAGSEVASALTLDPSYANSATLTIDDATINASKDAEIVFIPKAEWSNDTILGWLQ